MDHKEAHHLRLYVLAALFFIVAAVYIGVLYDTQVNNYDYYYASSVRSIARWELSSSTINMVGGVPISYLLASGGNKSGRLTFRKRGFPDSPAPPMPYPPDTSRRRYDTRLPHPSPPWAG